MPNFPEGQETSSNNPPLFEIVTSAGAGSTDKNQMRRKITKVVGKSMAATVPELVKILGGSKVIEKVFFLKIFIL